MQGRRSNARETRLARRWPLVASNTCEVLVGIYSQTNILVWCALTDSSVAVTRDSPSHSEVHLKPCGADPRPHWATAGSSPARTNSRHAFPAG